MYLVRYRGMEILQEADEVGIEDALPFLPDFATIDSFKAQITETLQHASEKVKTLSQDLSDYATTAAICRDDIKALRNR